MSQEFGTEAAVVPKRTKTPYVFAVIYDTSEGLKVQECTSRPEASQFVNQIGADKVIRAYKVSEVIRLKTIVKL